MKVSSCIFCFALVAGSLVFSGSAQATLGEGADSVARDRHALSAAPGATTSNALYTVQEVTSNATSVREYLNRSGVVFAVAWKGLVQPDLSTLLGSYAGEYQAARRQSTRRHGQKHLRVQSNQVVVETWGHMRNLQGRAYLPALLPEGVRLDEIK